jgi:bla regulator protein blaR1
MNLSNFWSAVTPGALWSHLWQSTAFAAVAWLLTVALRNYPARVRFSVWMAASLKFVIPFAILTDLGSHLARTNPHPQAHTIVYTVIEQVSQRFATGKASVLDPLGPRHSAGTSWTWVIAAVWMSGCMLLLWRWVTQWRDAHSFVTGAVPLQEGREIELLRRAESEAGIGKPISLLVTHRALEPGVFGVARPVLMWPAGLSERLDDVQILAILAHEVEHVRRRDNLTAAVHAVVEALFWFHPAVYWMRAKMSQERERACDEKVIEQSAEPRQYAESILKVCAFCLESPLPCVSGVSGSDLRERVSRIMSRRSGIALSLGRRALLVLAAASTLALPVGLGIVRGQSATGPDTKTQPDVPDVPKFEVASIKAAKADDGRSLFEMTPDGISLTGVPVQMLLRTSFRMEADRIIGAPGWVTSNRYDIEAKVAPEDAPKLEKLKAQDRGAMLISLLVERFNLKYHRETRELPMYALVVAKGGPKLTSSSKDAAPEPPPAGFGGTPPKGIDARGRMMMSPGRIESQDTNLDMLAHALSPQLGRSVLDKTGLTGRYDYTLQWMPDNAPPPPPGGAGSAMHAEPVSDNAQVPLFTAIQEQLGLKLESEKGSVDVIVIDHIDPPSPN